MKKIIKWINNIILLFLIIILCYVCYSKFIRKDEIITVFGKGFLVVITESMQPEIESGEFIIISEKSNYKIGDIVTYLDEEKMFVTHRIINIFENNFIAKGDNNNISDKETSIENIYGKVVFHSKLLGYFVLYFLKPILIIYIIYIIFVEILEMIKVKKNNINKNEDSKEEINKKEEECTKIKKEEN